MKTKEAFARLVALIEELGFDPDAGVSFHANGGSGGAYIPPELVTPAIRERMLGQMGEPKRGTRASYSEDDANWSLPDGLRLNVRNWTWDTCGSCGQTIGEKSPV